MKKLYTILLASSLAFVSCNKFLDMTPTDRVSSATMWESTRNAEYNINYLYTYIWDLNSSPTSLGLTESLTDELKYTSYNYNAMCYIPSEMAYGGSVITPTYVDAYMGYWGTLYNAIRQTNEALSYLGAFGKMSAPDKSRLEGEIRFMRAYLYFELVKRYHKVIIYDEDLSAITKDKALSDENAVWDFIQADLKVAAANLPARNVSGGRIDKGMAYALTSRAMLYAGRWDAVIAAADSVTALGYALEKKYADAFKPLSEGNNEAILQYAFDFDKGITHSFNIYYTPGGDYASVSSKGGAYGVPTQDIVESYEYADGGFPDWSAWHSANGTTVTPPYAELEPRFHATILYNGAPWKKRLNPKDGETVDCIQAYVGGLDGWAEWKTEKEPRGKTVTGYYLRKNVDSTYNVSSTSGGSNPFTFIRYAEVLLNKAEACLASGQAGEAAARTLINQVRGRVGLPDTKASGNGLWDALRQERKVELAFEGLRYWDLRRWKLSDKTYREGGLAGYQQHGLKITRDGDTFTYKYVSVDERDRTFDARLYQFPLPESELNSNSLVNQYPEWL